MPKNAILPRLSEKSYGLSASGVYVVDIDRRMNKHELARELEKQFKVKVIKVNLSNIPGKAKRSVSRKGRSVKGRDQDIKKAYVTLQEGHSLPFFAAIEEENKKAEETQAQVEKAMQKEQAKEEKTTRKRLPKLKGDK